MTYGDSIVGVGGLEAGTVGGAGLGEPVRGARGGGETSRRPGRPHKGRGWQGVRAPRAQGGA
jgi:hypothetical protein